MVERERWYKAVNSESKQNFKPVSTVDKQNEEQLEKKLQQDIAF